MSSSKMAAGINYVPNNSSEKWNDPFTRIGCLRSSDISDLCITVHNGSKITVRKEQ